MFFIFVFNFTINWIDLYHAQVNLAIFSFDLVLGIELELLILIIPLDFSFLLSIYAALEI